MKKWEKEILKKQLNDEQTTIFYLEDYYKEALDEVHNKIQVLMNKEQTQSVIYQLKYQQELEKQLSNIYGKLSNNYYHTIDDYLTNCYEDSFYSTMYSLHNEGIPTVIPFDQKEAAQMAAQSPYEGIQLSEKLYVNNNLVAKKARQEITKGIAMNSSYADIARNVSKVSEASIAQAYRITRTESHRINNEVKMKTLKKVQDTGADIVKQWDATIDKRTRPDHVALDGQLREIEQPFKTPSGKTAMYPGGFGIASEDINCRCACLQRARWALDKSEVDKYVGDLDGLTESQLDELAKKLGVSKEELIKASNGIIGSDGSINHAIKAKNYNQFKTKYKTKAAQQQALKEAQDELEEITKLENAAKEAEDKLNAIDNKKYSGIWKNDVTLADYEFKKDSIAAKRQWYKDQMALLNSNDPKYIQFKKYLDDLDEFESLGSKYLAAKQEYLAAKKALKAATGSSASKFAPEAYSEASKKAAKNFTDKDEADKYFRKLLDKDWDELSDAEKYSVWEYTRNSNPMNRSLSGYKENWYRSSFEGVGNVPWGYEDKYRSIPSVFAKYGKNGDISYHKAITDLTNAIEKMEMQDDCFLVRGSDINGLAGLLEGSNISFEQAEQLLQNGDINTLKTLIEGETFQGHSFLSTGIATGTGFGGDIKYKIYTPKGTKAIYAEPQSYYGDTISGAQLYKTGQSYSYVGSEAEVILQRGTKYRITRIEKTGYSSYTVEMEVVEQPDYFKYGDEETFNDGATRHKD